MLMLLKKCGDEWGDALTHFYCRKSQRLVNKRVCRFSIFLCGCKQPKSVHMNKKNK